ncbi:MAG: hypothetical protein ACJ71T_01325 [Actinomycetales bacterium]
MSEQESTSTSREEPDELADQAGTQPPSVDTDGPADPEIRENVVQRLLKGFHEKGSGAAIGDFIAVEFAHDPPTEAEHAEAHRRYVDELAEKGMAELGEPEE